MAFAYIFIVGYDEDGPYTDSLMDVSAALDQTAETYQRAVATAKRLGIDSTQLERLPSNMSSISLRARITNRWLHKVLTEEPIGFADLDRVLQDKQRKGTLKTFLQESRI